MSLPQRYEKVLADRKQSGLWRALPEGRTTKLDSTGQNGAVDFTHNDYLGLSRHRQVIAAAQKAAEMHGTGGRASRLLGANAELAVELETEIARCKSAGDTSAALVFPSGFQLNAGVVATLLDPKLLGEEPLVFADRLIHASLHRGIAFAGARQIRFAHNDLAHLEQLLVRHADSDRPKFVFVESIYGMDGDAAPIQQLSELKSRFGFYLYIDEAHSTGVAGENGYGIARQGTDHADIVIGTFSKALGGAGGYLVCDSAIRDLIINHCAPFIYSTAPGPPAMAAALAAWRLLPEMSEQREHLIAMSAKLRERLNDAGLDTGASQSNIVPVLIGDTDRAAELQERLGKSNIRVSLIRPPTVPPGTARLRIGISAEHSESDIDQLADELCRN